MYLFRQSIKAKALHTQPTVINPLAYEVPEQLRFIAKELSR